ncbi:MAG: hypothetical protein D6801_04255 [Alphaproteobacteria bacterium]|nr:MAG: hypothetical protein D6801_04255 [Alphaproteobacteria bacterium]
MDVSRKFILAGAAFLILGTALGIHMAATGHHEMAPAHAHINLLGFTLMTVFGLVYRNYPAMKQSVMAEVHFWLHLLGSAVMLAMLYTLTAGMIGEDQMVPLAPISELTIFVGVLIFSWNLIRNGK